MSWYHRIPIIGQWIDLGDDVSYEIKRARLEKLDRDEPIELKDDVLGTFRYQRELNWFELKRDWEGFEVQVILNGEWKSPDEIGDDAETLALSARVFWDNQVDWLARFKSVIVRDLFELAKEWAADVDCTLTETQFLEAVEPQSIGVSHGGWFEVWFDDGDVFAGHGILVYGTIKEGPEGAEIHG